MIGKPPKTILVHPVFGISIDRILVTSITIPHNNNKNNLLGPFDPPSITAAGDGLLFKWMDLVQSPNMGLGMPSAYKASLVLVGEDRSIIANGVFPLNVEFDYSVNYGRAEFLCDKAVKICNDNPVDIDNFDMLFEYLRIFANDIGAKIDVLPDPAFLIAVGDKTVVINFGGKITCGSESTHLADPEWGNQVKEWFEDVAIKGLRR